MFESLLNRAWGLVWGAIAAWAAADQWPKHLWIAGVSGFVVFSVVAGGLDERSKRRRAAVIAADEELRFQVRRRLEREGGPEPASELHAPGEDFIQPEAIIQTDSPFRRWPFYVFIAVLCVCLAPVVGAFVAYVLR